MGRAKAVSKPKERKPRVDKLREEMSQGNVPMFMSPNEVVRLAGLRDAPNHTYFSVDEHKESWDKSADRTLLKHKLEEAKTGTSENSHREASKQKDEWTIRDGKEMRMSELPSLYDSIKNEGFKGSFPLHHSNKIYGNENYVTVFQGHHRLAVMKHLNPKQFMPIDWHFE